MSNLAGNPTHPDHDQWIHALGRATYESSRLAVQCFDILRVWHSKPSADLYDDPLGGLQGKLRSLVKVNSGLPGLSDFMTILEPARVTRNDLIHALPVQDGLLFTTEKKGYRRREFFTVASLEEAACELAAASDSGNRVLYNDGGAAVRAWHATGGS